MGMFKRDVRVALCHLGFDRNAALSMLESEVGEIVTKRYYLYVVSKENDFLDRGDPDGFDNFYKAQTTVCAKQIMKEF